MPRHGRQRDGTRCQMQKFSTEKFHGALPDDVKAIAIELLQFPGPLNRYPSGKALYRARIIII
jgi:hypothetical protein